MKLIVPTNGNGHHQVRTLSTGARDLPLFESVLITRVLETGDIRDAVKQRVTEDFFVMPENRAAWSYLVGHYQEFGSTPSIELFRQKFDEYDLQSTTDSVAAVCDHLRTNKLYRDLSELTDEGVRLTRDNPAEALSHFRTMVARLTMEHIMTRDLDVTKTVNELKSEYDRVEQGNGMLGIPWPWPKLNDTTLGMQNGELIFIYARPKAGKTWLMVTAAVNAFRHGRRVLFITMEMPSEQIRRRTAAVWAKVNYKALRSGKLTEFERRRYFDDLDALEEMDGFFLSGGDENKGTGVVTLAAKIQEYNPDIVFVDGVYLMHDDRGGKRSSDWQAISHITQDLKSLTKRQNLPIVGSTQSNRAGEKTKGTSLSEMSFSDSFVQDGDYVIRMINDQREKDEREAVLTLPGIREAEGCTFTINFMAAQDFSQKAVAESQEEIQEFLAGSEADQAVVR